MLPRQSLDFPAVLFPNLRRSALAAEGKPNLTAGTGITTGPHAITHEQTAMEQITTKYAPSMTMTFLKVRTRSAPGPIAGY